MREVELKARVDDPARAVASLRAAGAVETMDGRLRDARYDTPDRSLVGRDHVLRLRVFTAAAASHASLDWKGPTTYADGYKVREELSTAVADPAALTGTLERLGYVIVREIDRHITQFTCADATVRLEMYPRMDALIEVEGDPAAIEAAIAATGLPRSSFTSERLQDFVQRFEARTGQRAALCDRELAGDYRYEPNA